MRLVLDEPIQAKVNKAPRLVLDEPSTQSAKSPRLVLDEPISPQESLFSIAKQLGVDALNTLGDIQRFIGAPGVWAVGKTAGFQTEFFKHPIETLTTPFADFQMPTITWKNPADFTKGVGITSGPVKPTIADVAWAGLMARSFTPYLKKIPVGAKLAAEEAVTLGKTMAKDFGSKVIETIRSGPEVYAEMQPRIAEYFQTKANWNAFVRETKARYSPLEAKSIIESGLQIRNTLEKGSIGAISSRPATSEVSTIIPGSPGSSTLPATTVQEAIKSRVSRLPAITETSAAKMTPTTPQVIPGGQPITGTPIIQPPVASVTSPVVPAVAPIVPEAGIPPVAAPQVSSLGKTVGIDAQTGLPIIDRTQKVETTPKTVPIKPVEAPVGAIADKEAITTGEGKVIPKLQPLVEEARKYKSAEEWIKSEVKKKIQDKNIKLRSIVSEDYYEQFEKIEKKDEKDFMKKNPFGIISWNKMSGEFNFETAIQKKGYEIIEEKQVPNYGSFSGTTLRKIKYKTPQGVRYAFVINTRADVDMFGEESIISTKDITPDEFERAYNQLHGFNKIHPLGEETTTDEFAVSIKKFKETKKTLEKDYGKGWDKLTRDLDWNKKKAELLYKLYKNEISDDEFINEIAVGEDSSLTSLAERKAAGEDDLLQITKKEREWYNLIQKRYPDIGKRIYIPDENSIKELMPTAKFIGSKIEKLINKPQLTDIWNKANASTPTGEGKVSENQQIINQIKTIKDNVSKDIGEDSTPLLKSLGIHNTDETAGVLSWDKMKRFNQSTENNIKEIYNHFARKQNSPLVIDIMFGNDPYNPLKDMGGKIESGGQLNSKILEKTIKAYQSINTNIQTQLSTPTGQKPSVEAGKVKKEYVDVALTDEHKIILDQVLKDTEGAQPGNKYVTRDEITGDVIAAGYEPSDYTYIPYWPKGMSREPLVTIRNKFLKSNTVKLTVKQNDTLQIILSNYKEYANEQTRLEKELASEGINQPEIDEIKRAGEEEAHDAFEVIRNEVKNMSTQDLEKFIDSQYESGAPQETLDLLETLHDARISEGELSIEEGEGAGLEEQLINMYHRYINPELRQGMEVKDILSNMRSALETYGFSAGGLKENVTDDEILAAAKELYLDKQDLIKKQKGEGRNEILDAYRKAILPEYNTNKEIVEVDALVDKIRELNPKDESDAIWIKKGNKFEATVSYPHSLGENGNQTTFIYKDKPTVAEIKQDVLQEYTDFKKDVNEEIAMGIVAKCGRDENIEQAIDKVLAKEMLAKAKPSVKKPKLVEEPSAEKTGEEGYIRVDRLNPRNWDTLRQFIEDDWIRVKRLIQQQGANVTETNNPYEAEIRYWGRIGARIEEADALISDIDKDIVTTAKNLKISDKLLNKEVDRFLIARHAPERNVVHGEKASGMTDKEAFEIRAEIAGKSYAKEVERIADRIQKLNNRTLDILLESDVINQELYDKLHAMYKNHIPLNRVMSEEDDIVEVLTRRGLDVQGAGLKRAKGSELEVADILTNVVANYKAAITRSEKNIVDNYTLRFARENDYFDGLFEEIKLPMLPVGKVKHKAAVDSEFMNELAKFAESLGAKFQTKGMPGRTLGTYSPAGKMITRKFATPREVQAHETGHFFDDKYKLKQRFYKRGVTKAVAEEMLKHMEARGESANRMKKPEERFADAFEWWLTHRDLAKGDLPLFSKEMENIINEIPELKPILKIEPKPGFTVESIEEMVFARQKFNTNPHVLSVREKGEQVYLKINDPQLAMALRGVNRQKVDGLMRGVKAFTRFYSGLMTRFNPEFVLSNKIRDLQEVAVYLASKNEIGFKGTAEAIVHDPISLKDVTDFFRGKNTEGTRLYKQMKMDGGTTGGMGLSTREQLVIDLNRIRLINRNRPRKVAEVVLRSIDIWNTIFEDSSRLSVYRQALKQGVSRNKAAVLAKEASVNFNKMGTGSPIVNALYMFSNASVQGSVKMIRAMRNPKVLMAVLALLGGAVFIINEYNDKKDKDWRKKVSKWDRLNGLNIVVSTDKGIKYVTIPISWGLKPIKVFFDAIDDLVSGHNKSVPDVVSQLVAASIEAYNPAGGTDFISAITPSILDIPVDIARNKKWSGGKICPDWNSSAPASIQYFDSLRKEATAQGFIRVTRELGERGIEISPADVDYAFNQLIGGTGRFVTKTLNTIVGTAQGKPQAKEIPFVSRFYRDIPEEQIREFGQDYNDLKKKLQAQDKYKFYLGQEAELAWDGIKQLPIENRKENYLNIKRTNPRLAEKIKQIGESEKLNLDFTDRLIQKLGVENGERSKFLADKLNKISNIGERKSFYLEMKKKKIITDEVDRQIRIRIMRK